MDKLIDSWRENAKVIRQGSPVHLHGEAEVWERCASELEKATAAYAMVRDTRIDPPGYPD